MTNSAPAFGVRRSTTGRIRRGALDAAWRPALLKETFGFVDRFDHTIFGHLADNSYEQST